MFSWNFNKFFQKFSKKFSEDLDKILLKNCPNFSHILPKSMMKEEGKKRQNFSQAFLDFKFSLLNSFPYHVYFLLLITIFTSDNRILVFITSF